VARRRRGTEERRAELLEAARALFVRDGFAEVSVSRIVRAVGVSQGTFYYYFESKEAVLDALLTAHLGEVAARLAGLAADPGLDPRQAVVAMVRAELDHGAERMRELGAIRGADARTKLLAGTVRALAPVYAGVIERGLEDGLFQTENPDLLAETFALMTHTLFDRDLLGWSDQQYARRRHIMADLFGFLLGLPHGSLDFGQPERVSPSSRSGTRRRRGRGPGSGSPPP
jgi:AcrR family transcriptional regulator